MQTTGQLTIRSLILTVVSVVMVIAINLIPAGDLKTFVLALDESMSTTTKIEYTGMPGQTVKGQIVIYNPSLSSKKIQVELGNLDQKDINQNNLNSAANLYECCKPWVVLPNGEFYIIEAKQKAVIPYEMRIPQDAEAKNYYGAFIVNEVKTEDTMVNAKKHCNIVMLNIKHTFSPALGMLISPDRASSGGTSASEINLYSPIFAVLAALMLATGLALLTRWCIKNFKAQKPKRKF